MEDLEGLKCLLQQAESCTQAQAETAVGSVESFVRKRGLSPENIEQLVEFIVSCKRVEVAILVRLIRSLLPHSHVPCLCVLKLLASLRNLPFSLQELILQWTVLVFDYIDDITPLRKVYDAVFYFLQYDNLRATVCQLLCYLTAPSHVTKWRTQRLLELQKQIAVAEPSLVALLDIYQLHCPDLVTTSHPQRKLCVQAFETSFAADIARIQAQKIKQKGDGLEAPPTKKSRTQSTTALEPDLLAYNLCLPQQMSSVLNSTTLMQYFAVCGDVTASARLKYWLMFILHNEFEATIQGRASDHMTLLLRKLIQLRDIIIEPIPVVEQFLEMLLKDWDGDMYRSEILELLSYISLQPFDNLHRFVLLPLKHILLHHKDPSFKYSCLATLTTTLERFASLEWPRYQCIRPVCLFHPDFDPQDFNAMETIVQFIHFTDDVISTLLQQDCTSDVILQHSSCAFHTMVTRLPSLYGVPVITIPNKMLTYQSLFTISPVALVQICECLINVKLNIERQNKMDRDRETVVQFNTIILDMVDALWRNCAFSNTDRHYPTAVFHFSREFLESCGIKDANQSLNLTQHRALAGYTLRYCHKTLSPHSTLQPTSILTSEIRSRESFMEYLKSCHLDGLVNFINEFVRTT